MSKILLIDGNSLMFRSFYATAYTGNLMKTKSGLYTNALFGFVNMVSKLINEKTEYAFVAFDAGKQTFRHQQYDEYKGGRKPLPEELKEQIPLIKEYLDLINVKRLESLDYEADDLIATVATKFKDAFDEVLIYTGDHDLLQLVDEKISVCLTKRGVGDLDIHNQDNFYEKNGIYPNQLIDYKGICGDSSDNLPGIKGMGNKTTIKLLNQYNNLDGIYMHLDELTPKAKILFEEGKDIAYKCKFLATLCRDAKIDITIDDLKVNEPNTKDLVSFYTKVEFNSMLKKIKEENVLEINKTANFDLSLDYQNITGDSMIICEVFGSNYYNGTFLGLGILNNDKYYFIDEDKIDLIKDYLENPEYKKYTFDYKTLNFLMLRKNINLDGVVFDLLINSYLINPEFANEDFKIVVEKFGIDNDLLYYENIYGANTKMTIPERNIYVNYCLSKCKILKEAKNIIYSRIIEDELEFLVGIEMDLSEVLSEMEYNGLKIDLNRLTEIGNLFEVKAKELEQKIYDEAGRTFNINSPKQLGEILFEEMKLPYGKKNKTGYSTNVDVLEKLAKEYQIAKDILEYRGFAKLVSTYVKGIFEVSKHNDENNDDYIHPLYKQALTHTGRLSSVEPNIQNMPIRTENGQVIREIFTSRFKDGYILSSDYSQIELRVLAHISKDEKMLESFNNHIDIHTQTASQIFEVSIDNVTKDMRRTAKAINFGIIYGMSPWGLAETLGIAQHEANRFIDKYFYNFQEAKSCLDKFVMDAYIFGYSKTMYGRRRYIPQLKEKNGALRGFGERTAMNSPIQGSAADIIKIAMIKVNNELKKHNLKTLMIAQVHDELVFDVPNNELEIVQKIVKETMESAVKLDVLLEASVEFGKNWFEAK